MALPIKINLPSGFLNEEERYGYRISAEVKAVWAVELDLLVELLRVCKNHGITIYADGGTILGAVRHKGFIPWDNDIDMMMMRKDYDSLCEIAQKEFKEPYFFQTEYTDPGSLRGHAQLRNSLTTGMMRSELKDRYTFNQGIFIDIFPLDAAPDDMMELSKVQEITTAYIKKSWRLARLTSRYSDIGNGLKGHLKHFAHILLTKPEINHRKANIYYRLYEKACKKYNEKETKCVAKYFSISDLKKKQVWKREWFSSTISYPFEFISIPLPVGYIELMDVFFGDWRTPKIIDTTHGEMIFDVTRSYKEYLK